MMESPQFLQQMSSLMSNPEILDQVIASNPQLQEMGPQIREIFQSEQFRQIMCVSLLKKPTKRSLIFFFKVKPRVAAYDDANVSYASRLRAWRWRWW